MGVRTVAAGTAGTLRGLGGKIRAAIERKRAKEEKEEFESIRVPLWKAKPKAMPTPIGEAITEREADIEVPDGEPIKAPMATDISTEQQAFETTMATKEAEEQKAVEEHLRPVEELPLWKQLTPSGQDRLRQIAEANNWIQDVGGVLSISNKQLREAQDIISRDLKTRRELNELALNDVTQEITGLKQSMLDPKMKEEERVQAQGQLENLLGRQEGYLNAVNMMSRAIQEELATREPATSTTAPHKTKTEPLGKGRYQDWERIEGNWQKLGKSYKKGGAGERGEKFWNSYRQYLKQAESFAYRDIFANDPRFAEEMEELRTGDLTVEEREKVESRLHTALSSTQRAKLDELTETYLASKTPKPMLQEWLGARKRGKEHKVTADPLGLR